MWVVKADGDLAENTATGETLKVDYGKDNLFRVKQNYRTLAVFDKLSEARQCLIDRTKKLNGKKVEVTSKW